MRPNIYLATSLAPLVVTTGPMTFAQVTAWKRGNGELAAKLEREEWRTLHEEVGRYLMDRKPLAIDTINGKKPKFTLHQSIEGGYVFPWCVRWMKNENVWYLQMYGCRSHFFKTGRSNQRIVFQLPVWSTWSTIRWPTTRVPWPFLFIARLCRKSIDFSKHLNLRMEHRMGHLDCHHGCPQHGTAILQQQCQIHSPKFGPSYL